MNGIIVAGWALYVALVPFSSLDMEGDEFNYSGSLLQTAAFDFRVLDLFRVYTTIEIRETKAYSVYFDPYRADFLIGGEFFWRGFALGISHECNHDIVTGIDLHPYNGWDAAFGGLHLTWSGNFSPRPEIVLLPQARITWQFYDTLRVKPAQEDKYFRSGYTSALGKNLIVCRLSAETVLHGLVALCAGFQPEFSVDRGAWNRFRLDTGLEFRWRGLALGFDFVQTFGKLPAAGYNWGELRFYLAFRGTSRLL